MLDLAISEMFCGVGREDLEAEVEVEVEVEEDGTYVGNVADVFK